MSMTIAYSASEDTKDIWMLDTCASYHMTPNRDAFISYTPSETKKGLGVKDANGGWGPLSGTGTILLQVGDAVLKLEDVRHIPSLKSNLISYGQLAEQGFDLSVTNDIENDNGTPCHIIKSSDGDEFVAIRNEKLNVYCIDDASPARRRHEAVVYECTQTPNIDTTVCSLAMKGMAAAQPGEARADLTPQVHTIVEWHQRLCHLNQADITQRLVYESRDQSNCPSATTAGRESRHDGYRSSPLPEPRDPWLESGLILEGGVRPWGLRMRSRPE